MQPARLPEVIVPFKRQLYVDILPSSARTSTPIQRLSRLTAAAIVAPSGIAV
jgi:hypothetical protein